MNITEIEQCIKKMTKESRFNHSKGVQFMAVELAKHYGLDVKKAELAGLMHDCVKNLPVEEMFRLCDELGCELDEVTKRETKLIHAPLGAFYAKKVFGVEDEEVFNAIYWHTTAKENMTLFEKVIFIADVVEPNRKYDIIDEMRKLAFENIDLAMLKILDYNITKQVNAGKM
ncbi:MAG: bis(5'-nucleosyl)-tetraphosphatase (symmetrical) YqeK, partial [Clostridia bacterium]|nr:bis(5'-nucleosyl)-tetraphosphatase (symmetrical) YqeK [Clostridia bacterium]